LTDTAVRSGAGTAFLRGVLGNSLGRRNIVLLETSELNATPRMGRS